jgi:hypothetical protein
VIQEVDAENLRSSVQALGRPALAREIARWADYYGLLCQPEFG